MQRRRRATHTSFACTDCGYTSGKWLGFCPQCRAEQPLEAVAIGGAGSSGGARLLSEVEVARDARKATGVAEFDRVVGGGLVDGSVVLVGGEPGVGKSTLLLQIADGVAATGTVLLASAEESASQVAIHRSSIES